MDVLRLRKLRTTQFILVNSFILIATILFTFIIHVYSLAVFQRTLGVIILILAVMNIISKTLNYNLFGLFPAMRELITYEAKKLGKEFTKVRWTQVSAQLFVALMMLAQSFFMQLPPTLITIQDMMLFTIPVLLLTIIGINISLVYHVKKIDKGTTESLKGYNSKSILIGLAIGIPLGLLSIIASFLIVAFM
ncbi:hypothetical protein [Paenibacillus radicis (ex Xue et al. 2023)]|uniref:Uncharacterized protein n=1 Tax=Paenibacillus radicis (ex Xue et al. 2023) TaxID=2972489 RepID=A0ABT1YHY5_9BACL|nr:hypothetical protein [Paenibacillus radicis (ex Xue et al. 2023)]MCR8632592.1 hypothetical protein [Paenibacillus radicis (ex Xue et al. 2023)]